MDDHTLKNSIPVAKSGDDFQIGQILGGKYQILSLLGRGGMGAVYRVKQLHLGVELALKTLEGTRVNDVNSVRRFQTEAKAAFSLQHPNLVKVHDFGILDDVHPFLVMDLVEGKTLESYLKARGQLSLEEIEAIFVPLCFGLAYAHHQGVVHRDLKPANIMLVDGLPLGMEGSIKVLDFGIAKIVGDDRGEMQTLTQTGEIFGSPLYMSPEQCAGGPIDQRSDVYSLGCVLFEALTGTPPLVGSNALRTMMLHVNEKVPSLKEAALGSQFPIELEKIVSTMLAKEVSERYSDLSVVAHKISQVCAIDTSDTLTELAPQSVTAISQAQILNKTWSFTPAILSFIIVATGIISSACTLFVMHLISTSNSAPGKVSDEAANLERAKILAAAAKTAEEKAEKAKIVKNLDTHDPRSVDPGGDAFEVFDKAVENKIKRNVANSKRAYARVSSIQSKIVEINGVPVRQVVFPNHAIGAVVYTVKGESSQQISANGVLNFPANATLKLYVHGPDHLEVFINNYIFDKISNDVFDELFVSGSLEGTSERFRSTTLHVRKYEHEGALHLLKCAEKWKKLHFVELKDLVISGDILECLNHMPLLASISFSHNQFEGTILKQKFLSNLHGFDANQGDMRVALKLLAKSPRISFVGVSQKCIVSADAISSFKDCRTLKGFWLRIPKLSDDVVTAVMNLTVPQICLHKDSLSPEQFRRFKERWDLVSASRGKFIVPSDSYLFEPVQIKK